MPHPHRLLLAGALAALPLPLAAQGTTAKQTAARPVAADAAAGRPGERATSSAPSDPDLARAYELVVGGDGARGRALVDSLLAAAPPRSPRYAEVLYWRAAFAATTADAERDYKRLSVEFPLSSRAADALIALAQLEYVRGDTTLAVHHLQRLAIEHPAGVRSAKANFWAARVLFEAGDPVRACSALRAARATAGAEEVELRNQVELELPKCRANAGAGNAGVGSRGAGVETTAAARPAMPAATAARSTKPADGRPAAGKRATGSPAASSAAAATSAARARDSRPTTPDSRRLFSVQVAAYTTKAEARALAAKLTGRGYAARVAGGAVPYRVRVGRYGTRAEAAATLERMRRAKLGGLVVEAEPR